MLKALHKIDFDAVPSLHLFDTLIAPILNYNCGVLNQISKHRLEAINNNAYSLEKLYFDTPGEKVHLQLCRNILGVSNKTSVVATFGELGCYPLMIGSFSQMIKYWHHIKTKWTIALQLIQDLFISQSDRTDLQAQIGTDSQEYDMIEATFIDLFFSNLIILCHFKSKCFIIITKGLLNIRLSVICLLLKVKCLIFLLRSGQFKAFRL